MSKCESINVTYRTRNKGNDTCEVKQPQKQNAHEFCRNKFDLNKLNS